MVPVRRGLLAAAAVALVAAGPATAAERPRAVEVVVALEAPPLARAVASSRVFTAAAKRERLSLRSPSSVSYVASLAASQRELERRLARAVPRARVRWRYHVVVNGVAVVVPPRQVGRLASLPGVARVYPSVRYRSRLDRTPRAIGAPTLWGSDLSGAGRGIKIGILDDGIDQSHAFFDPRGYAFPPGFPKGNRAFTTAKVIVARAFPPASPRWRHAAKPFDPEQSVHATHVAGIAAGNNGVSAAGRTVSGVAPRAYLGNYKVLTIPTASGVGLDGNAPEIAAGIEAAVRDGMDVINLSLGEPEIEPQRDLVTAAINAAADAGVVPTIAGGNDFKEFGRGSVGSPGTAAKAITAGAVTDERGIASFSSAGPTPLSLRLKPEVAAPGTGVLSSVPQHAGTWAEFSGTSMAAPHVAGAAALLLARNRSWTPAQVKSALVQTAEPLPGDVLTTRQGGGLIDLPRAANPRLFADPAVLSFGLLTTAAASESARTVRLADAGGGAGLWTVRIDAQSRTAGVAVSTPPSVAVPGELTVTTRVSAGARTRELTGFVVLSRGGDVRRIPYWLRTVRRDLPAPTRVLRRTGTYGGNITRRPSRVSIYRYPENPSGAGVATTLAGPELVFRVRITRRVANFGVAVLRQARGVAVQPRVVVAGDENRQVGYTSLPLNLNPYLADFLRPRLVSGAVRPARGSYDVVFDTRSAAAAGRFTFRFWIDDTTPPRVRLLARAVARGRPLVLAARDAGSGIDPRSLVVAVDGRRRGARYARGRISIPLAGSAPGRHRVTVQISDHQETRNMENVARILPNTRRVSALFTVR